MHAISSRIALGLTAQVGFTRLASLNKSRTRASPSSDGPITSRSVSSRCDPVLQWRGRRADPTPKKSRAPKPATI